MNASIQTTLGLGRRLALVAVGVAGLFVSLVALTLWATEPVRLPLRTQLAFGGIAVVGLSWAGFAWWSLRARYPLFGRDRVVSSSIASIGSLLAFGGAMTIGFFRGWSVGTAAALAIASAQTAVAVVLLVRSRRRYAALVSRRNELEVRLAE